MPMWAGVKGTFGGEGSCTGSTRSYSVVLFSAILLPVTVTLLLMASTHSGQSLYRVAVNLDNSRHSL
jgi:hypothetical protein